MERFQRLQAYLNKTTVLISSPEHITFFTGIETALPCLFLVDESNVLMAGPSALKNDVKFKYFPYTEYSIERTVDPFIELLQVIKPILSTLQTEKVMFEYQHLPHILARLIGSNNVSDVGPLLKKLRRKKEQKEIGIIKKNMEISDQVFSTIPSLLTKITSVKELVLTINGLYSTITEFQAFVDGCFGAGQDSDNPDAQSKQYVLKPGEHIFIDLYPKINGYFADSTRVFSLGRPGQKQQDIHSILEEALVKVEPYLYPGSSCKVIDRIVRNTIEKYGYGVYFPHHTGHGFGIDQQESPFIAPGSTDILEVGDVIAIEPGIYLPGWGGMRLESAYFINENHCERLDHFTRTLTTC